MLITTNPNCFTYTTDELLIELLGGVRVDTFDRMRVTMKVTVVNRKHAQHLNNEELAGLSVRHNIDLYNDTQVEKFVRRVAERLETGSDWLPVLVFGRYPKTKSQRPKTTRQYFLLNRILHPCRKQKALRKSNPLSW